MKDINGKIIEVGQLIRIRYMHYIGCGNVEEIEETYILEDMNDVTDRGILSVEVLQQREE